ncbi:DNA mismatch repair protein MutS [Arenibacter sp. GZD96]|uniref:Smr/MutS family protein n=1 Tax=Aurantibrevibacter litoralis TaxID=3106030 RepID=UPI002AFDE749|nr:Smr/MutS family protein [Arenibacter sp. GZD-96]MEA1785949.1 DNA mismatch repair protein MutS [Arenibacter sp. GZD-96]
MTHFKIGDRVEAIDDVVVGIITNIASQGITIESDEGFELYYKATELLPVKDAAAMQVSSYEVAQIIKEKELPHKRTKTKAHKKESQIPVMEVDLHVGQLRSSTKGMSNFEILNLQLDTAKRQLEFAMNKRIQSVVFIHGIGEGILKEELHYMLRKYDNLKFYDANYQKYGLGATEVYIFQNVGLSRVRS